MIIESFMSVASREGLNRVLHFGAKSNHIAVRLNSRGEVMALEPREGVPVRVPWAFSRTAGLRPNLLGDSQKYFVDPKGRAASQEFHEKWAAKCGKHPAAKAVKAFFKKDPPEVKLDKKQSTWDFVFYFKKEERPICEKPELYDAIAETLREEFTFAEHPSRFDDSQECVLNTHGKLNLMGLNNPQALLGFNQNVTWGGGFHKDERMLHAAMSYDNMRDYVAGLTWIAKNRRISVPQTRAGAVSYYVWSKTPHRFEELLPQLLRGCPKGTKAQEWREWVVRNFDEDTELFEDSTPLFVMSLLCGSRIAVRNFTPSTVGEIATRIRTYFDEFVFQTKEGTTRVSASPYFILAEASVSDKFSVSLVERFYDAIFMGTRYPQELLAISIKHYLAYVHAHPNTKPKRPVLSEATLNAVIQRQPQDIPVMNTTNLDNPFFTLGQLFAVLEARNHKAKDNHDVNKISRKFGRFLKMPAITLPDLKSLSEHHLSKIQKRKKYSYVSDERVLYQQLETALDGGDIPMRTSPQQQNWIIRGRQHQLQVRSESYKKWLAEQETKGETVEDDLDIPAEGV